MNLVTRAWNYQPAAEVRRSIKAKAAGAIVWLLALMLCLTLISRATSSMTVPVVQTEKPSRATINHTVTVDGVLETTRDTGVVVSEGALVQEVHVKEGDRVTAGGLLFTYDTKDFNRQISDYQTQLAQINTRIKLNREQRALEEESRELARERAQEDLEVTDTYGDLDVQLAEEKVRAAGESVRAARIALDKYDDYSRPDLDDDSDDGHTRQEYDALRSNYRKAQIAYDEAGVEQEKVMAGKEKAILDAARMVEDSSRSAVPDATVELEQLNAQMINLKLSVLYEAVANKGEVYAPMDGVVTGVKVSAGTRTTDEAAMFINNSETMHFVTEVSKDQKKQVNTGNTVKLRMAGETKDIPGLEITSIQPASTEGFYRVTIEMPADYLPGTSGTVEIQQKSQTYDTVLPLSTLRVDGSQYYVMKVRQTETSMGDECFTERVDVTLLEKNETYAAVSGALSGDDKVIASAKATIQDGDRVRLPIEE